MIELDLIPCECDFLLAKVSESMSPSASRISRGLEMEVSRRKSSLMSSSYQTAALYSSLASISIYSALRCDGLSFSVQQEELTESPTSCPVRPPTVFLQGAHSPMSYSQP